VRVCVCEYTVFLGESARARTTGEAEASYVHKHTLMVH
jgi:hypothetical protein